MIGDLPIRAVLPELQTLLASTPRAILSAPPGSGKTTLVPLALLEQPWLAGRTIVLLEPRRLAARAAAMRMASLTGDLLGQTVGYRVRFDSCLSATTRIEVMTEGVLIRRLQKDPELTGVGLVIFDEFHERSLQADLALALVLDVTTSLRPDLRLLVMSATLESGRVAALLGDAPIVRGVGSAHPVVLHYLTGAADHSIVRATLSGVLRALTEQDGDLLVFLPGSAEIRQLATELEMRLDPGVLLCPLYGDLPKEWQLQAILADPGGRRRIVLATSIAESSLTIEGISTVVDSGWSRLPRFHPNNGLTRLETIRVTLSSAEQRSGRAGRLGPGVCYRLWNKATHNRLQAHLSPEILDADLASLVLELALWGVNDPWQMQWLDPPTPAAVAQARTLLTALELLDVQGHITAHGRCVAQIPIHPRLAHMLLRAAEHRQSALAADLAALVSERDILQRSARCASADIDQRLDLLTLWRREGAGAVAAAGGNTTACARVIEVSRQLRQALPGTGQSATPSLSSGVLLAFAYPERIAQRRQGDTERYLLASGRGVRLPAGDPLAAHGYLVVADLDAGRVEGRVHLAVGVDSAQLRAALRDRLVFESGVTWDTSSAAVIAHEQERLGALVLGSRTVPNPDPAQVCSALLVGIREVGIESLPWGSSAQEWRARVESLRQWQPDADWVNLSDAWLLERLEVWLAPWLYGITRLTQMKQLDLAAILKSQMDWASQQRVEQLVPSHIRVPSGSLKPLSYHPGEAPVLRVRLQEMFGLAETPTVCDGMVTVSIHLLSPAQRPVQITQDLAGFWDRTYAEVRKELKGRYPKHYWPENPWEAQATARVRPELD